MTGMCPLGEAGQSMNEPEGIKLTGLKGWNDEEAIEAQRATDEAEANRQLKDIMGQVFKELESKKHRSSYHPHGYYSIEDVEALKSKWGIK